MSSGHFSGRIAPVALKILYCKGTTCALTLAPCCSNLLNLQPVSKLIRRIFEVNQVLILPGAQGSLCRTHVNLSLLPIVLTCRSLFL